MEEIEQSDSAFFELAVDTVTWQIAIFLLSIRSNTFGQLVLFLSW
jgi:hypothetical protein